MPLIITFTSIAVFIKIVSKPLLPGYIVIVLAYCMKICSAIGFYFVKAVTNALAANVSCKRIQVSGV
jgi:hypothetical protein